MGQLKPCKATFKIFRKNTPFGTSLGRYSHPFKLQIVEPFPKLPSITFYTTASLRTSWIDGNIRAQKPETQSYFVMASKLGLIQF